MYKVTVIVPVYNSSEYLKETINSILNQNLKEIEIILIDDGSEDNSLDIIKDFAKNNQNIKYYEQENMGPGVARNLGIKEASGEFLTFLDSDDLLEENTFSNIYKLVSSNDVDLFIGNILCFNETRTWHLAYMKDVFEKSIQNIITNINESPYLHNSPSVCNKWFKTEFIKKNHIKFENKLFIGEDLLFMENIYINNPKIIASNFDIYRYRILRNSLVKRSEIKFFSELLILQKEIKKLYSNTSINEEMIIKRQINFFIDSIFLKICDEEYVNEVIKLLNEIIKISEIDLKKEDFKIIEKYSLYLLAKLNKSKATEFLKMIIKNNVKKELLIEDGYYSYISKYFPEIKEALAIEPMLESKVEDCKLVNGILYLSGYAFIRGIEIGEKESFIRTLIIKDKETSNIILKKVINNDYRTDLTYIFRADNLNYDWAGYEEVKVDIGQFKDGEYECYLNLQNENANFDIPFKIKLAEKRNKLKIDYLGKYREVFIKFNKLNELTIRIRTLNYKSYVLSRYRKIKRNLRYEKSLIKNKKYKTLFILYYYRLFKSYLKKKEVWLIGERRDTAQDNSYHIFKYIKDNNKKINAKYLIDKNSKEFEYLSKYNKKDIIFFDSIKHNLYLLTGKYRINSYAERPNMYTNNYLDIIKYYPELDQSKRVFLQHGVIGVSRVNHVLHKNKVNYDKFIVSSEFEKTHLLKEFGYDENEIAVTGLARWDNLKSNSKKNKILLMPTWRSWIKSEEELIDSDYFNKYLEFLNNDKLITYLEESDSYLTFYPHYQTQKLFEKLDYKFNKRIQVIKQGEKTVQEIINDNYLLITDYSTVSFDFAYKMKPVIFYQFDYDEFYSNHYNAGPIDHKKELFGSRVTTIDELTDELTSNKWIIKEEYIRKYIDVKDIKHSEKIVNEILDMDR